jgi:hypothetical protein
MPAVPIIYPGYLSRFRGLASLVNPDSVMAPRRVSESMRGISETIVGSRRPGERPSTKDLSHRAYPVSPVHRILPIVLCPSHGSHTHRKRGREG